MYDIWGTEAVSLAPTVLHVGSVEQILCRIQLS